MPGTEIPGFLFGGLSMVEPLDKNRESRCCPDLLVVECTATRDHCHLICAASMDAVTRQTVTTYCIADFACVLRAEWGASDARHS